MYIAPSTSGDKITKLLYCRCDNENCQRRIPTSDNKKGLRKSVRMHHVFDFVYDVLGDDLGLTEKEYNSYYANIQEISVQNKAALRTKLDNKRGLLKHIEAQIKEYSLGLLKGSVNDTVKSQGEVKVTELSNQKDRLTREIQTLELKMQKSEEEKLSLEQFLNLSKKAPVIVKEGSRIVKGTICRFIFLNIDVGVDEMLSY